VPEFQLRVDRGWKPNEGVAAFGFGLDFHAISDAAVNTETVRVCDRFIRYAVQQELSERQDGLTGVEERIAATLNQVRNSEQRRLCPRNAEHIPYLETLAKALLTCVPESPADARPRAVACAKERHLRLIKSAGRAMVGESKLAMEDLVGDLERP